MKVAGFARVATPAGVAVWLAGLCVSKCARLEEDLKNEIQDEHETQHTLNSIIHDHHPWGGFPGCKCQGPKSIIASVNSSRREDVQRFLD